MHLDKYRVGYYRYYAKTLARAVDPSNNAVFVKFTPIEAHSTILVCLASAKDIVNAIAQTQLSYEFSQYIKTRTSRDAQLKSAIGRTRYKVQLLDYVVKIYKDEILFLTDLNEK